MKDWLLEGAIQIRNASPVPLAFVGDYNGWFTLDNTIKYLGVLYIVLQIGYLGWKWRKEARHGIKPKG